MPTYYASLRDCGQDDSRMYEIPVVAASRDAAIRQLVKHGFQQRHIVAIRPARDTESLYGRR